MFCSKCGNPIVEGDAFCSKCGTPTKKVVKPVPVQNSTVKETGKKKNNGIGIVVVLVLSMVVIGLIAYFSKDDEKSVSDKKQTTENNKISTTPKKITLSDTDNIKGTYSPEEGSLTITWDAVPDADRYELSDANSMRVHENLFTDPVAVIVEGTSYTVYGVKSGTNYIVKIRAIKGSGNNAIYSEGKDIKFDIP